MVPTPQALSAGLVSTTDPTNPPAPRITAYGADAAGPVGGTGVHNRPHQPTRPPDYGLWCRRRRPCRRDWCPQPTPPTHPPPGLRPMVPTPQALSAGLVSTTDP